MRSLARTFYRRTEMLDETEQNLAWDPPSSRSWPANQFSLRALLWAVALVGVILAPIANFGTQAFGAVLIAVTAIVLIVGFRKSAVGTAFAVIGTLWFAAFMGIFGSTSSGDRSSPFTRCRWAIHGVRAALEDYAQKNDGRFPRTAMQGSDGRPWHSWRVSILPQIGEESLYNSYSWTEPWDGSRNRRLAAAWPSLFECSLERDETKHSTVFVLVTGPGSAWGDGEPRTIAQLKKLPHDTIVMMEVKNCGIHWMEPRDLTIDEIMGLVDAHGLKHISPHDSGLIVLNAGRHVESLPLTTDRETLRRRLTAAED